MGEGARQSLLNRGNVTDRNDYSPPPFMKILCPATRTIWGELNSLDDLKYAIARSGQGFGQDLSGPASNYNPSYPSNQTLYQYMGWGLHGGLDIPCVGGTEIYASHDGVVVKLSETISQGLGVVIRMNQVCETVYWHHRENLVKVGQEVKQGDLIAISDNTGYSLGNHLHFEYKIWGGNGYVAVDPIPHIVFKNDMKFVKVGQDGVEVWIIQNSKRSHISNSPAFQVLSGNWAEIEVTTQAELDLIPDTGIEILGWEQK